MSDTTVKKLKRRPRRKVIQERDELLLQQAKIRMETDVLLRQLNDLRDDEAVAFKGNDGSAIAVIEAKIETVKDKISENDRRYEKNVEVLETYSKVVKNDSERNNGTLVAAVGVITSLGGLALAGVGLKKAYQSDEDGTLVRKKTFDWVKNLPIIRDVGRTKHS